MPAPKFNNRYRIPSARAEWWDYGKDAPYSITCCTKGRQHLFGKIRDGRMELSAVGAVADVLWHQIPFHFPDWELGEFVVMPNHIHGVLIKKSEVKSLGGNVETGHGLSLQPGPPPPNGSAAPPPPPAQRRFQNPGRTPLSTGIGAYKSSVTRNLRRMGISFDWQTRFHDHIIRDSGEFDRITRYIANNVANWRKDRFNG